MLLHVVYINWHASVNMKFGEVNKSNLFFSLLQWVSSHMLAMTLCHNLDVMI